MLIERSADRLLCSDRLLCRGRDDGRDDDGRGVVGEANGVEKVLFHIAEEAHVVDDALLVNIGDWFVGGRRRRGKGGGGGGGDV